MTEITGLAATRALPANLAMDGVAPATRLLEKRRQMFEVQEALEAQKHEFARKEEVFCKREEALKRRDLELQESLIRFSKFLQARPWGQENDSKRARAEKKAADEIKARQAKEVEIGRLAEVLEGLGEEKERVDDVVDRHMRYQRYLEAVLEAADEYQEIGELLARHATLQATNRDLRAHKAWCDSEAERLRSAAAAHAKARGDELLLLNNRLAALKQDLEGHAQAAALLEASKDGTLAVASQRTLVYGQVVLAADNLFTQCRQRSRVAHAAAAGPLQQLEVIGNYVSDLVAACKAAAAGQAAAQGQEAAQGQAAGGGGGGGGGGGVGAAAAAQQGGGPPPALQAQPTQAQLQPQASLRQQASVRQQ
ncbi:MAG: hypothetical protein J3K34DRAFT_517892 [Monoraphidium minutum]|nr:MAG: hypothetical protein J3K34DRAFT_517892 [Monoraphidium minutum]